MVSGNDEINKSETSINNLDQFSSRAQLTDDAKGETNGDDDDDYQPYHHRNVPFPTQDSGALAHLLKCSLGSGILSMPNAFRHAGLAFGMVGTILVGILCAHCAHLLAKSSYIACKKSRQPMLGFAETAEAAFATGPPFAQKYSKFALNAVNGALILTHYSASTVYVVLIAQSAKEVCDYYFSVDINIRIYIAITLIPLTALCLIRNLKYLVPSSMVANVFMLTGIGITLYYTFVGMPNPAERDNIVAASMMPVFFTTVIFAMEGIGVVMPVENSMKNPGHFLGCPGVLNTAMSVVVVLYAVMGFFGYLKYGEGTKGSITSNLDVKEVPAQIVKILVPLAIMFTYPLQFFVPTNIVLTNLKDRKFTQNEFFQNGYRIAIVTLNVAVAVAVPQLGPIVSLVGAVCFSTLGLLCPAVIETIACWDGQLGVFRWRLYKNIIIVILSICALVAGSYTSIVEIIETYSI